MPKYMKAQMWDKMQYLFRNYYDRMIHIKLTFDTQLDIDALKKAYKYLLDKIPVLRSSYHNNFIKPYWRINSSYDINAAIAMQNVTDESQLESAVKKAITYEIKASSKIQLRATVIRLNGKDTLVQIVNHMCMDGGDLKHFTAALASAYSQAVRGEKIDVAVKEGDRSHWQLYSGFDSKQAKIAKGLYNNISRIKAKTKFPFTKDKDITPRIVVKQTDAETYNKIKEFSKNTDTTVNDIILAAYIRRLYVVTHRPANQPLDIPCMVDLRRYIDKKDSYGYSNHVGFMISEVDRLDADPKVTLAKIKDCSHKAKSDPYMGLYALPLLNLAYTVFPHFISEIAISLGYDNPYTGLSNIGVLNKDELTFGSHAPIDAYITGAIKKKPYMQLSVCTYEGRISFTIADKCGAQDEKIIRTFLDDVIDELYNIIA